MSNTPQLRLRAAIRRLANAPGRRVTNVALAAVIDVDESHVRRLLSDASDLRVCFERHLVPWAPLLGLSASALVQLWADAHEVLVDVAERAEAHAPADAVVVAMAEAGAAEAEAQLIAARAVADGAVTPAELAETERATERAVRARRAVTVAAKRMAVR